MRSLVIGLLGAAAGTALIVFDRTHRAPARVLTAGSSMSLRVTF